MWKLQTILNPSGLFGPCTQIILPPLFGKLDTLPDGDRELLPLMECLTAGAWRVYEPAPPGTAEPHAECCPFSLPPPCRSGGQDRRTVRAVCSRLLLPLHRAGGAR